MFSYFEKITKDFKRLTVEEVGGFTFLIDSKAYAQVGDVTIAYRDDPGQGGFVLTSSKSLSEWKGFGVTQLRI